MFRRIIFILILFMYSSVTLMPLLATGSDVKDEIKLGRTIAAIIAGSYGVDSNDNLSKYVNLVGNTVTYYNGRNDIDYYFAILDSDSINAFACPGGYIFITKGLLYSLNSEAELAGVLAHEVAHINGRHVYNAVVQKKSDSADSILAKMIGGRNVSFSVAFNQVVNKGLEILLKKGLSHADEFEADSAAVIYMENAGYNKDAYMSVMNLLQKNASGKEKFSTTHPPIAERINNIKPLFGAIASGQVLDERFRSYVKN